MHSAFSTLITGTTVIIAFAETACKTGAGNGRKTRQMTNRSPVKMLPKRERLSLRNSACCPYFGLDCNHPGAWRCFSRLGDNKEKKYRDAARGKQCGDGLSHDRPPFAYNKISPMIIRRPGTWGQEERLETKKRKVVWCALSLFESFFNASGWAAGLLRRFAKPAAGDNAFNWELALSLSSRYVREPDEETAGRIAIEQLRIPPS
jgi:hypothetical protein